MQRRHCGGSERPPWRMERHRVVVKRRNNGLCSSNGNISPPRVMSKSTLLSNSSGSEANLVHSGIRWSSHSV